MMWDYLVILAPGTRTVLQYLLCFCRVQHHICLDSHMLFFWSVVNVQIFDDFCCDCKVSHYSPYHLWFIAQEDTEYADKD